MASALRAVLVAAAIAAIVGACGSDSVDENGASASVASAADDLAEATTTSEEPTTTSAVEGAGTSAEPDAQGPGIAPGEDPEVDAVVTAFTTVFDSTAPVEAKTPYLQDAASLRPTLEAYAGGGSAVGGITLVPGAVAIEGDMARITYDVNFAGNEAYGDQEGEVVRIDGAWVVAREQFCAFMASARTPCP